MIEITDLGDKSFYDYIKNKKSKIKDYKKLIELIIKLQNIKFKNQYYFDEKKPHISNYWNLSLQNSSDSEDIILKKLEKLLTKSIELRLESDAPVGALLSGGLDSSIMVAILNNITETPVKTFTTGFGHELDEYNEAKIVAEHCGTDHNEIELSYKKLTDSLPNILFNLLI